MARKAPAPSANRAAPAKPATKNVKGDPAAAAKASARPAKPAALPKSAAAEKSPAPARSAPVKPAAPAKPAEGSSPAKARPGKAAEARHDLLARAAANAEGAYFSRSDPLADAKAARAIAQLIGVHERVLSRRGLSAGYTEAALQLAAEIEDHLQSLPAAGISVRERSQDKAELLAEAAATAHAVREAVVRVTRGPDGRRLAHAFGLGEPFSVRQHAHVLKALQRILAAAQQHPSVAADIGLGADDLSTIEALATDLGKGFPETSRGDEHRQLLEAQGGLRAWFDLVAAKALLAFAGDPDERGRLLSLLPRADDRRHARRKASETPAA